VLTADSDVQINLLVILFFLAALKGAVFSTIVELGPPYLGACTVFCHVCSRVIKFSYSYSFYEILPIDLYSSSSSGSVERLRDLLGLLPLPMGKNRSITGIVIMFSPASRGLSTALLH